MCKLILDGRHGLAPINAPEHIVDIATGTGIWAVDFGIVYHSCPTYMRQHLTLCISAKQHPQSTVVGIDLSEFGTLSAPNVTFLQQDAEKDAWEFAQQFDYVHMRFVVTCFTDMRTVLRKALDNIKPGGWIEIHDVLGIPEFFDDGAPAPALERWCALCQTAAANIGRDFKKPLKYKSWLREVGFVDVEQRIFKSPGNTWPSNPKLKKIGALQLQSLSGAMEGLRGGFLAAAGVSNDKADDLLAKALEEMRNTNCHFWWPV